jgi:hypothetical protein
MMCEFSCLDFASLVKKEQRHMNLLFEGSLMPSHDAKKGYPATYYDFAQHAKMKSIKAGPCKIDCSNLSLAVCKQIWPHVVKKNLQANLMMNSLFKLAEVRDCDWSPFCKKITSPEEMLAAYILYCPRTFSFKVNSGNNMAMDEEEDDDKDNDDG